MLSADFLMSSSSNDAFHLAMLLLVGLFIGLWSIMIIGVKLIPPVVPAAAYRREGMRCLVDFSNRHCFAMWQCTGRVFWFRSCTSSLPISLSYLLHLQNLES